MDFKQKNIAFYLKYRPQRLDQLIGQDLVKKNLLSAYLNNKLSHAYLFVGPRGTGKTSTARILAKMVNCESQGQAPCNECNSCVSITDGSNLDLLEIDAASNRGIEDIRSLRDKIKLSPSGKIKIYIIDEVHMLTTEAFNALLKTLEEPPAHALFILATTEGSKIPQTILSRVQRLDFKLASNEELSEALKKIITSEKIEIEEEALKFLVKKSEGSFRDGVKLLDQIYAGEKITLKFLEENLRSSNFEDSIILLEYFSKKDTTNSLLHLIKMLENINSKDLIISLSDLLRNLVFIKNGLGEKLVEPNFLEEKYSKLKLLAESFSNQELVKDLDILQNSLEKLKFTSIPSLPLELAVVEITHNVILNEAQRSEGSLTHPSFSNKSRDSSATLQNDREEAIADIPISSDTLNSDIQKLKEKWTFVLETIRPYNFSLEALLRSINISECTDTTLVMEVPYSFHQRILEAPKNREILESIVSEILGRQIRVSTVLGSRPQRIEDLANIEVAADDEIIRAAAEIFNSDTVN